MLPCLTLLIFAGLRNEGYRARIRSCNEPKSGYPRTSAIVALFSAYKKDAHDL